MKSSGSGQDFETAIKHLETSLFDTIKSQTTELDKQSLLAIQNAVRNYKKSFVYLEIGSPLGGSIQPYLLDPKCAKIFSIDKRPEVQADERRKEGYRYAGNSSQRMIENLKAVSAEGVGKITVFDSDASDVDKALIRPRPDVCFIDGEHTNSAVVSDFVFCRSVVDGSGIIVFHDCQLVFQGIVSILKKLRRGKEKFKACFLPANIFVITFGDNDLGNDPVVKKLLKKIQATSIKRWILWGMFPDNKTRVRFVQYREGILKALFKKKT